MFPKVSCKYYYYYNFDEKNMKSKICLPEGAICPEEKPYEIISTKECILSCSYENLIISECKLSNKNIGIEQIIQNFRYEIENNNQLINKILYGNFSDLTILGNNIIYQITTTVNQQIKIEAKINDGISSINLGECESILKRENQIGENVSLIILKYDFNTNESISKQVEYKLYNPLTRKNLNLDLCKNKSINLYIPVDINEDLLEVYQDANNHGYDIFDPENKFYKDICTPYTSKYGTDIILSDRFDDILNNTGSLCEINCNYMGIYTETKKVLCECSTKVNNSLTITKEIFSLKKIRNIHSYLKSQLNYKVLTCYRLIYDFKKIIYNYGFFIMSIIIILFVSLVIINFISSGQNLKLIFSKIVEERKNYIKKIRKKNNDALTNLISFSNENESKQASVNNKKSKFSTNKNSLTLKEPPKKIIKKAKLIICFSLLTQIKLKIIQIII